MNWNVVEGNWKEMAGRLKEKWGELTGDEIDGLDGSREQLAGLLQKKYGGHKSRPSARSTSGPIN